MVSSPGNALGRPSGRAVDQLRAVELTVDVNRYAEGSCLAKFGNTHVLCTATLEEKAPPFLKGSGNVLFRISEPLAQQ